jgi:polyferredoxin
MISRLQSYRKIVRYVMTALFFAVPFMRVNGESLLRFDVPTLRLFFFGKTIYIESFFIMLLLIFAFTFLFIALTQLFGRIWCGWLCPQTLVVEITRFLDRKKRSPLIKFQGHIIAAAFSVLIAAAMVWYFVSPYDFLTEASILKLNSVTAWFWMVLSVITYANFAFFRHGFCTTVCPYAKLQGIMYDNSTMVIAMNPQRRLECIECLACVKACPTGVDIRQGLSADCINCAECIDACAKVMAGKKKKTLIGYFFGPQDKANFFRTSVLISGTLTAVFFASFIYMLATIKPYEFEIYPWQGFMPRETNGKIINSYELKLKSVTKKDVTVNVSIDGAADYELQPSETFTVKAGETLKEQVFILVPEKLLEKTPILSLNMTAVSTGEKSVKEEAEASFRRPVRRKK